jgi:hypothetical protein
MRNPNYPSQILPIACIRSEHMHYLLLFSITAFFISCAPDKEEPFTPTSQYQFQSYNYFKDAEHFLYAASYGLAQVGELRLDCSGETFPLNNNACYKVMAHGQLTGLAGGLSSLDDTWESLIDTSTLLPCKFSRDLKENKYRKKEYTLFHRMAGIAEVHDTTDMQEKLKELPITPQIQDMLSVYFLFRNIPFYQLKTGDTVVMDVFLEESSYNIKVKLLGREKIKTKFGKKNAIIIAPLIPDTKILSGEYPVKAWISDDALKIPLRVQVKIILGSVDIILKEYSNTKTLSVPGNSAK